MIEIRANARQYSKAFQNICYEFLENPLLSDYPSKGFYDLFVIKYLVYFLFGKLRLTTHILFGLILPVQTFLHAREYIEENMDRYSEFSIVVVILLEFQRLCKSPPALGFSLKEKVVAFFEF